MNQSTILELLNCIKQEKPAILFLGQDAYSSAQQDDPILLNLLKRLDRQVEKDCGWMATLSSKGLSNEDMDWLTERYQRYVQTDATQNVFDLAWSALFTTLIDPKLTQRLESRGRQPEAVISKDHFARVPRSRFRPPIHHLLGRSNEQSPNLKAPQSKLELRQRIAIHTNSLLNRIAETVTPLGLLVVDGFTEGRDWLMIDELLAHLSESNGLRILWFGATPTKSDFFPYLVEKGFIKHCPRRLFEELAEVYATNPHIESGAIISDEPGIISLENGRIFEPPASIRLRVEASSAIVDDNWTSDLPFLDEISTENAFHLFHGDLTNKRSFVEGIARGFSIKRDFESDLREKVEKALRDQGNLGRFIVLHGQSGTGKSVAIARLAYDLRKELKVPVIYASGRMPQPTDIDEFCELIEKEGAIGTVILCDANLQVNRYKELTSALRSRGRKITLVGTTYNTGVHDVTSSVYTIKAPSELSKQEGDNLVQLVKNFSKNTDSIELRVAENDNALAYLYRILSSGRKRIVSGLSSETRVTEVLIRDRAKKVPLNKFNSILAEQLIAVGLHDGVMPLFDSDEESDETGSDAAGVLIDYVMASGRINCPIPINLLIRTLNLHRDKLDYDQILYLFGGIDLFRWHAVDTEGNVLLIGPRIQLEAELMCKVRLADKTKELQCLLELVESVRPYDVDNESEINYLLDLLHKLGRDGYRGEAYSDGYLKIARTLTNLRTKYNVLDARLMLQESTFRRQSVYVLSRQTNTTSHDDENIYKILNEARDVVEFAIREISDKRIYASRRTMEYLQVERGAIYGYLAVDSAREHKNDEVIWSNYLSARTAINKAMAVADSYFPLDVGLWTPIDILERSTLSTHQQAEMATDIYSVIDQIDSKQLTPSQQEKLHSRRMKIGRVLGDNLLEASAFNDLLNINPQVAYFLYARDIGKRSLEEEADTQNPDIRAEAREAALYLIDKLPLIKTDAKCLNLLLQLLWVSNTGDRLLRGERRPIPSKSGDISTLRDIVTALNSVTGENTRFVYRYLEATLEWVNGDTRRALDIWSALGRDTEYEDPSRIIRRLFIADLNGKPVLHRGRVEKQRGENHWVINVEGLSRNVDLMGQDFKGEDLKEGREIRDFAISFNFRGPIADPVSRYGGRL